jgi:uncharacterized protein (TIGR02246 family)
MGADRSGPAVTGALTPAGGDEARGPERLYYALLECWNARDPAGFAALFEDDGHSVGFDGSEMHGPDEIESTLRQIFTDHETGRYVARFATSAT